MNVRELKHQVTYEAGTPRYQGAEAFYELSDELGDFYMKLNEIGGRNLKTIPPDTVSDIDATVELENAEAEALIAEFRALLAKVKK